MSYVEKAIFDAQIESIDGLFETVVKTLEAAANAHRLLKARVDFLERDNKMLHSLINEIDEEKGELEDRINSLGSEPEVITTRNE